MSDVETGTPETGSEDVHSWFKARLSGSASPTPATEPKAQTVTEPESDPESEADEADPAEQDEAGESQQDESEAAGDDESEGEPDSANLDEFEINGKKIKLPPEAAVEVRALAKSLQGDYTRKTMEVAEQRKAAEAIQSEAQHLRQQYAQGLQISMQFLQSTLPQPPSVQLRDEDPIEYLRQKEIHGEAMQKFQAIAGEMQRVQQHQQDEARRQFEDEQRAQLKAASEKLPDVIPEWRDAGRATREKKDLANYLQAEGYSAEEIGKATDVRAIKLSLKAMKYDRMMAKRATVTPAAPTVAKPGPSKSPTNNSAAERSKRALAKSGRPEDGLAYFKSILFPR